MTVHDLLEDPEMWEAAVLVLISLAGLIAAAFVWAAKQIRNHTKDISAVKHQVENDHDTNMRDDLSQALEMLTESLKQVEINTEKIDELASTTSSNFRRVDKQYGELHRVLTQETEDRQALQRQKENVHDRIWQAIDELRKGN